MRMMAEKETAEHAAICAHSAIGSSAGPGDQALALKTLLQGIDACGPQPRRVRLTVAATAIERQLAPAVVQRLAGPIGRWLARGAAADPGTTASAVAPFRALAATAASAALAAPPDPGASHEATLEVTHTTAVDAMAPQGAVRPSLSSNVARQWNTLGLISPHPQSLFSPLAAAIGAPDRRGAALAAECLTAALAAAVRSSPHAAAPAAAAAAQLLLRGAHPAAPGDAAAASRAPVAAAEAIHALSACVAAAGPAFPAKSLPRTLRLLLAALAAGVPDWRVRAASAAAVARLAALAAASPGIAWALAAARDDLTAALEALRYDRIPAVRAAVAQALDDLSGIARGQPGTHTSPARSPLQVRLPGGVCGARCGCSVTYLSLPYIAATYDTSLSHAPASRTRCPMHPLARSRQPHRSSSRPPRTPLIQGGPHPRQRLRRALFASRPLAPRGCSARAALQAYPPWQSALCGGRCM